MKRILSLIFALAIVTLRADNSSQALKADANGNALPTNASDGSLNFATDKLKVNGTAIVPGAPISYPGYLGVYNGEGSNYAIGLALSGDGQSFVKLASNPILTKSATGWDSSGVKSPCLVRANGKYFLYYDGTQSGSHDWQIGLATSTDGLTWTKFSGNPVIAISSSGYDAHRFPTVVYDPDDSDATQRFKMWYVDNTLQISYAYSSDGYSWTNYSGNPVVTLGTTGQWDSEYLYPGAVIKVANTSYLFYQGRLTTSGTFHDSVGIATFTNPKSSYSKFGSNPVISPRISATQALTSNLSSSGTTVVMSNTSVFQVGEPVLLENDSNQFQLTRVSSITDGTHLVIESAATVNYTTAAHSFIRSIFQSNVGVRSVARTGKTFTAWGAAYEALPAQLDEFSVSFSGSSTITGAWKFNYWGQPVMSWGTLFWESASSENLCVIQNPGDANFALPSIIQSSTSRVGIGVGVTPNFPGISSNRISAIDSSVDLSSASGINEGEVLVAGSGSGVAIADRSYTGGGFVGWHVFTSGSLLHFFNGGDDATLDSSGNLSLNGTAAFKFASDTWYTSSDGKQRMYSAGNADTIFKSGNTVFQFREASDTTTFQLVSGQATIYRGFSTAGVGLAPILSAPAISSTKTANFTVASYAPSASVGVYRVQGVITTTSSTNTGTVQFTLDYKDSQGTTHTADVIPLINAAGSVGTTGTGASKEFHSMPWQITVDNSATSIALKVVITGTVSYTVTGSIEQIQ